MKNFFIELITGIFGKLSWLGTMIFSMIPLFELRGAIPLAMMQSVWGEYALPWYLAYLFAVIGATIPALIIIPLLRPVFAWMKKTKGFKKIANFFDGVFTAKSKNLTEKVQGEAELNKKEKIKFWGIVTFVAIPLPLTGAWTGSVIASYLNMKTLKGSLAILLGNLISGAIMTFLCVVFAGYEDTILLIFTLLVVAVIIGTIVYTIFKKSNKKQTELLASEVEIQGENKASEKE